MLVATCSRCTGCSIMCITNGHHALVEDLDRPLNHRQEHLLEGDVSRYGCLNLDQIEDVLTKEAVLVVLIVQMSYLLHHTFSRLLTLV